MYFIHNKDDVLLFYCTDETTVEQLRQRFANQLIVKTVPAMTFEIQPNDVLWNVTIQGKGQALYPLSCIQITDIKAFKPATVLRPDVIGMTVAAPDMLEALKRAMQLVSQHRPTSQPTRGEFVSPTPMPETPPPAFRSFFDEYSDLAKED
jgi:hypothetical protein